jgi:Dipeptide/tripeptide permease
MLIYVVFRGTFKHADVNVKQAKESNNQENIVELTPQQTRSRMTALFLVFAVIIFFWMSFHQNGLTLTFFARDYTVGVASGILGMSFNVFNLVLVIAFIYALFSIFQSKEFKSKIISLIVALGSVGILLYNYLSPETSKEISILPQIFQQFNPFFVVALTPISLAIFGALAAKGKEPSSPKKIGIGMFIAALGFLIMAISSINLPTPNPDGAIIVANKVSPTVLISTYLVLTFAELFLSPMGISFVSKVAPPKYKGLMMGCWFGASGIGNYLVLVIGILWGRMPLWSLWTILIVLCLISSLFIFMMLKRLENATK